MAEHAELDLPDESDEVVDGVEPKRADSESRRMSLTYTEAYEGALPHPRHFGEF